MPVTFEQRKRELTRRMKYERQQKEISLWQNVLLNRIEDNGNISMAIKDADRVRTEFLNRFPVSDVSDEDIVAALKYYSLDAPEE